MTQLDLTSTSEQLSALVEDARLEDLPDLLGRLEAAMAMAWARLAQGAVVRPVPRQDRLLSMPEAATILGIPEDRAYDLARQRRFPVVVIGKYRRVRESVLRAYIAASERPRR